MKITTSSFDKIFVLKVQFLAYGTEKGHLELDPVSKMDGQAVQTVIFRFLPWQLLVYETKLCLCKTAHSFSEEMAVFPQFLPCSCQVMMCDMIL